MLRLSLGDLVTWQDAEYTVAAATAAAILLCRLVDGERVWVNLPAVSAQIAIVGQSQADEERRSQFGVADLRRDSPVDRGPPGMRSEMSRPAPTGPQIRVG